MGVLAVLALISTMMLVTAISALAAAPAAVWHMSDPAKMTDGSGNGNHGTTTNVKRVSGSSGNGYRFNGSSSIAKVPSSASLNPGIADILVTAHVRFEKIPGSEGYDVIRKGLSTTRGGGYKMEISRNAQGTSARATCTFTGSAATESITNTTNLADGSWHKISCAKSSTAIKIIVDGKTSTKKAKVGSITNAEPLTVGAKSIGGDWYAGDMDEVSVRIG